MAQRRAAVVALGGVVEDDVEDDLEAGAVQGVDHRLELGDLAPGPAGADRGRVAVVGGEEADGVVAPVVRQAPLARGTPRARSGAPGSSSTAVTPRSTRWAMAASCAEPGVRAPQLGGHVRVASS